MNPAQARERSQFENIQTMSESIIELSKAMNRLDTVLRKENAADPEGLRQDLQGAMQSLSHGHVGLTQYVRHCDRMRYDGLSRTGGELLHHLESIQSDMQSIETLLARGGKHFDWYKAENLAMSVHRFQESLELFKQEGALERFEPPPLSLRDVALPAALTIGGVLLTRSILKSLLDD